MEFFHLVYQTLRDISPDSINHLAQEIGPALYVLLFGILFAETGLVVTPFLPGDSLLFAVGAVAAAPGSPVNLALTAALLCAAAVLGDAVNYFVGYRIGPPRLLARGFLALEQEASERGAAVLRPTWRQDDHPGAVRADHSHVRAVRRRDRPDELRALRAL